MPAAGVPASVAVPLPLLVNVTPVGSVPVRVTVAAGKPVVVMLNVPAVPIVNEALFALVMAGAWLTVSVKLCCAGEPTPLVAVMVSGYAPPVAADGVPAIVAVPLPLSVKVTPAGSVPVRVMVAVGPPVVVTEKVPGLPTTNVVEVALVMAGAAFTFNVKDCTAGEPMPFEALNDSA